MVWRVFVHGCITDWLATRHDLSLDYYPFHTGDECMMWVYWMCVQLAWTHPFICNENNSYMNKRSSPCTHRWQKCLFVELKHLSQVGRKVPRPGQRTCTDQIALSQCRVKPHHWVKSLQHMFAVIFAYILWNEWGSGAFHSVNMGGDSHEAYLLWESMIEMNVFACNTFSVFIYICTDKFYYR